MDDKLINMLECQIGTLNITKNEEKPLENITLNWLSGSNCFKGREDTLNEMKNLFISKNWTVLHGSPGIGKTETARHFAEIYSKYLKGNLTWVPAAIPQNIKNCFKELTSTLELKLTDVFQVSGKFVNSSCLVIFDNAENMAAIGIFLPSSKMHPTVNILITSQLREWDASVATIHIDALKPKDAVNILKEKLGDTFKKKPQEIWCKLVERLKCIPLSIQIVTSLLYEKFRTIPIENFNCDSFINNLMNGTFINSKFPVSERNLYNKTVLASIHSALNLLCFIAYLDADDIYYY